MTEVRFLVHLLFGLKAFQIKFKGTSEINTGNLENSTTSELNKITTDQAVITESVLGQFFLRDLNNLQNYLLNKRRIDLKSTATDKETHCKANIQMNTKLSMRPMQDLRTRISTIKKLTKIRVKAWHKLVLLEELPVFYTLGKLINPTSFLIKKLYKVKLMYTQGATQ